MFYNASSLKANVASTTSSGGQPIRPLQRSAPDDDGETVGMNDQHSQLLRFRRMMGISDRDSATSDGASGGGGPSSTFSTFSSGTGTAFRPQPQSVLQQLNPPAYPGAPQLPNLFNYSSQPMGFSYIPLSYSNQIAQQPPAHQQNLQNLSQFLSASAFGATAGSAAFFPGVQPRASLSAPVGLYPNTIGHLSIPLALAHAQQQQQQQLYGFGVRPAGVGALGVGGGVPVAVPRFGAGAMRSATWDWESAEDGESMPSRSRSRTPTPPPSQSQTDQDDGADDDELRRGTGATGSALNSKFRPLGVGSHATAHSRLPNSRLTQQQQQPDKNRDRPDGGTGSPRQVMPDSSSKHHSHKHHHRKIGRKTGTAGGTGTSSQLLGLNNLTLTAASSRSSNHSPSPSLSPSGSPAPTGRARPTTGAPVAAGSAPSRPHALLAAGPSSSSTAPVTRSAPQRQNASSQNSSPSDAQQAAILRRDLVPQQLFAYSGSQASPTDALLSAADPNPPAAISSRALESSFSSEATVVHSDSSSAAAVAPSPTADRTTSSTHTSSATALSSDHLLTETAGHTPHPHVSASAAASVFRSGTGLPASSAMADVEGSSQQ